MRLVLFALFLLTAIPAQACSIGTDCQLGERSYRIHIPEQAGNKLVGAIVFAHGWRGTAAGTMKNASLIALADELGVALVAPQSVGDGWQLPGRPGHPHNTGKEEFSYFRQLISALKARHGINTERLLMTGFSGGGMLVWNLACHMGDAFAGYAPIAGTFWEPLPPTCPSAPVHLMHFHGTSDTMVPVAGRPIADTKQGDVMKALELFASAGGYGAAISKVAATHGLNCNRRINDKGRILEYCRHEGGHIYKAAYVRRAWKAFIAPPSQAKSQD